MQAVCVNDVDQQKFIQAFALHLKKSGKLSVPEWYNLVKTGTHKELPPVDDDWFFTRCAAVLRRIYVRGNIGIGGLSRAFGGRKRRGTAPAHFQRGSKCIARKALQSLEAMKLLSKDAGGGRVLTSQGRRDADRIATQVARGPGKQKASRKRTPKPKPKAKSKSKTVE